MSYAIGIDIGGTKVAIGIVDQEGNVIDRKIIPTDLTISPLEMVHKISHETTDLIHQSGTSEALITGVGVGAPGPLDSRNGMIVCPPNLTGWVDVPIVEELKKSFAVRVVLENDANAAALAEKWVGAARKNDHFIYITVSTGIGAGLYLNGNILSGTRGNAGDIGHIVVNPAYGECQCGQSGCLESISSGTAIAQHGSNLVGEKLTTKEVFDLYFKNHPKIVSFIQEAFKNLGVVCVTMINLFDPEKIVIGGGVSEVGDPLFDAVHQYVKRYVRQVGKLRWFRHY